MDALRNILALMEPGAERSRRSTPPWCWRSDSAAGSNC